MTTRRIFFSGTLITIASNGSRVVHYDDNDIETLDLMREKWSYINSDTMNSATSGCDITLASNQQTVLSEMFDVFGKRLFLRHHSQVFEPSVTMVAYSLEE